MDNIAERAVQLGGVAEGTARMVAKRSSLHEYPANPVDGHSHADALSAALAAFGTAARKAIDQANGLGDLDTADVFTENFAPGAIPWGDAFASSTAFTGMWLMAKKKVESWYWWIATNIASIPLYFVKGLVFTSCYYVVLLVLAVFGLISWLKSANKP